MSRRQRIFTIITGLLLLVLAILMIIEPIVGLLAAIIIISLILEIYGIRELIYYFTMARHMVGGRMILYLAIIFLDLGFFTGTLSVAPQLYILVYFVITYAITGVISVLRGIEAKRYDSPSWKWKFIYGIINIAVVILSVVFVRSVEVLTFIFSIGLLYSAIMRIISAFRSTDIVYIQ